MHELRGPDGEAHAGWRVKTEGEQAGEPMWLRTASGGVQVWYRCGERSDLELFKLCLVIHCGFYALGLPTTPGAITRCPLPVYSCTGLAHHELPYSCDRLCTDP